ncbi:hypothetical protein [Burkholderia gladioli]|uniref:hypothetical protein n=1 Tax=Burkholderia gladioli TaxID=28095 RepID=UPI00163F4103|nr:hypothetical protein [Burkholderia gladioli]MBU9168510.1 hypothetical protein [Burkholderia gladioli]
MNSPQLCGAQNSTIDRKIHPIDNKMKRSIQGMKNQLSTRQIALQFQELPIKTRHRQSLRRLVEAIFSSENHLDSRRTRHDNTFTRSGIRVEFGKINTPISHQQSSLFQALGCEEFFPIKQNKIPEISISLLSFHINHAINAL